MKKPRKPSADEKRQFAKAMADVRPLDQQKVVTEKPRPKPIPQQSRLDEELALVEMANGGKFEQDLEYGDEAVYQRPEVTRTVMRKLRRGQYKVQDELDLHGYNMNEAKIAMKDFLRLCHEQHYRCVRIIHGKGHRSPGKLPVLKPKVAYWLSQRNDVAAFVTARPVDGGTGALYVLLR